MMWPPNKATKPFSHTHADRQLQKSLHIHPRLAYEILDRFLHLPEEMKRSILPSESHVMSARVVDSLGSSSSLCRGMIGNSCSIAHTSTAERKTDT